MGHTVVGALLVRNEAAPERYLRRAVENALKYCQVVVALDDNSTDATREVLSGYPRVILTRLRASSRQPEGFWGHDEASPRARLWQEAAKAAGPEGWVYVFDADHLLDGITPEDFGALCTSETVNAWAFPLLDLWDTEDTYRTDGYWQAHHHPRVWLARALPVPQFVPVWPARALHSGHLPANYPVRAGLAPARLLHLGYVQKAHREAKAQKYLAVTTLAPQEHAHATSILAPATLALVQPPKPRILLGSVVRKPPEVVGPWLETLAAQVADATVEYSFVADLANTPYGEATLALLHAFVVERAGARLVASAVNPGNDYGDTARTRAWTPQAWHRVGALKDGLLREARDGDYDFCFLVDADVFPEPRTLQSLLDTQAPIVSGVYWTCWQRALPGEAVLAQPLPQVWARHPYNFDGLYQSAADFLGALTQRALVPVGGLGACTLIRRDALLKGVAFAPVGNLGEGGMADGEDRHFSVRATQLHLSLVADAWPDIYHAYHPEEYALLPQQLARFAAPREGRASVGDLVSVRLELLESPAGPTPPPQTVRGRLGALPVLQEIADTVATLSRRESALVRVLFPAHWGFAAGQRLLLRVTLLDHKPFRGHPTLEDA